MVEFGLHQRLPATPASVPDLRESIRAYCERAGAGEPQLGAITLTITEAATNAVRHAYRDGDVGAVDLDAQVDGQELIVRLRDYGTGLVPHSRPRGHSLGLGLVLMERLADECVVESCHPGTRVTLRFRLDQPADWA
jgi:anti-sigma regulatory factor (Ser/Thr protein kinase)